MADNVVANSGDGLGPTFHALEFSFSGDSGKTPLISGGLATGSEGSWTFTLLSGGAGAVDAGVQRVTLASDDPAVTALAILDDWDESDRAKVNIIAGQAGVTAGAGNVAANTPRVTLAADDPLAAAVLADDAAFTPATSKVFPAGLFADEASTDSVNEGDIGAPRMTLDRKAIVTAQAHTTGGADTHKSLDLDESEEEVKATAGQVYGFIATNRRTSPLFLKFYNDTAANVSVGTTTPKMTLEIPANATDHTMVICNFPVGVPFDTAICIAATTGFADNDTGAPGANELIITVFYK